MVPAEFAILDQNSSAYHPMLMINILFGFYFGFFFRVVEQNFRTGGGKL
jgi:hypothetical protein